MPLPLPLPFPEPFPLLRAAFDASCTEEGTAPVEPGIGLFSAGFGCGTVASGVVTVGGVSCFFACPGGSEGGVATGAGVVTTGAGNVTVDGGDATGTTFDGVLSCFFAWPGGTSLGATGVVSVDGVSCFFA